MRSSETQPPVVVIVVVVAVVVIVVGQHALGDQVLSLVLLVLLSNCLLTH